MILLSLLCGIAHGGVMNTLARVGMEKAQNAEKKLVDVADGQAQASDKTTETSETTEPSEPSDTTETSKSQSSEQPGMRFIFQASPEGCWIKVDAAKAPVTVSRSGATFTISAAGADAVAPLGIKETSWTWTPTAEVATWFVGYTKGACKAR